MAQNLSIGDTDETLIGQVSREQDGCGFGAHRRGDAGSCVRLRIDFWLSGVA